MLLTNHQQQRAYQWKARHSAQCSTCKSDALILMDSDQMFIGMTERNHITGIVSIAFTCDRCGTLLLVNRDKMKLDDPLE
jgi:hypothetical protein